MTDRLEYDVAIVGAGSAGLVARRTALAAGARVVMIDPGPFGTTCARVGCMPSKLLIAAAQAAAAVRDARRFGIMAQPPTIDGAKVMQRVRAERDRLTASVIEVVQDGIAAGDVLAGRAQITGDGRLHVEGHGEVKWKSLVLATGSTSIIPKPLRALAHTALSIETVFEQRDLPKSLLVFGLGAIGLELGQAFHQLGVRTTLLGVGGQVGPLADPEVLKHARSVLGEALDLHPEYQLRSVRAEGEGAHVVFVDSRGREREEVFSHTLIAAGRRPNLEKLGLEQLGVQADSEGRYPIDRDTLQLADLPVFVAGDANQLHPLLHEAADDGKIAAKNALRYPELDAFPRRTPLSIVFCEPQIALVGQSYASLQSCEAAVGAYDFADQARARMHGDNRGYVRIYGEHGSGKLLGAELFLPRAEHMAHLLAWSIQQGVTVEEALAMPFYHPVFEEGLRTALRDLASGLRRGERIKCAVEEVGVGG